MVKVGILRYPNKEWFVYVCGLNGTGLIPGDTLKDEHVSKAQCDKWFGAPKTKNGYTTTLHPEMDARWKWLWKRVHQGLCRKSMDFGLQFAQGLLYEYRGHGECDWASMASRTVCWYGNSKGGKPAFSEFASAYPSVTINLATGQALDTAAFTGNIEIIHGSAVLRLDPLPPRQLSGEAGCKPVVCRARPDAAVSLGNLAQGA